MAGSWRASARTAFFFYHKLLSAKEREGAPRLPRTARCLCPHGGCGEYSVACPSSARELATSMVAADLRRCAAVSVGSSGMPIEFESTSADRIGM